MQLENRKKIYDDYNVSIHVMKSFENYTEVLYKFDKLKQNYYRKNRSVFFKRTSQHVGLMTFDSETPTSWQYDIWI